MVGKLFVSAVILLAGCAKPNDPFSAEIDGGGPARGDGGFGADGGIGGGGEDAGGGPLTCPAGFADCDGIAANGCETNLNTADNCGGCGKKCVAAGGVNNCVLGAGNYVCKPSCDANHADCNMMPDDGCETDVTSSQNCGSCGAKCSNPHGTTVCTTMGAGYFCAPTCDAGWGQCYLAPAGCTSPIDNDVAHCGACTRPCSNNNVATQACSGGLCTPTCNAPWSDCGRPTAPNGDDGCETNGTLDPGEPDNTCNGQTGPTTPEGSSNTINNSRILPAGDADTFTLLLQEGSHICFPFTSQHYNAKLTLSPPESLGYVLGTNINACDNTWNLQGNSICINWSGTCATTDDLTIHFQVTGPGGLQSCSPYAITIQYCPEGQKCPGC